MSTEFAPRLRARAIWKSKSLKMTVSGRFWRFNVLFAWQAQGFRHVVKYVERWQCGGFEEGPKWCLLRGRRRDFVLCDVGVWSLGRCVRGKVANFMSQKCYSAGLISRGSYRGSYASALLFCGRRSTFEASTQKSLKRIGILRSCVWSTCHFWRKSRRNASFLIFKASFLKQVSRKKASFLSFKTSFLKDVSHKSFVFLASTSKLHFWRKSRTKKDRFWASTFHFWRKSRAKKDRFWSSKLHFWRKSRTKASFLSFKASFLKEVSHKSFVFELQSFIFEGSLAQKGFVFELQMFMLEGSLAEKEISDSLESQTSWQPNQVNPKSFDNQINWISNQLTTNIIWITHQLTTKAFESQITWQRNKPFEFQVNGHPKSFGSHIGGQPNHLNLKVLDIQIIWTSNQLTSKPFESRINWRPESFESQINRQTNHCNRKSTDNHTHLNLKSNDKQNHLNLRSIDNQISWVPNQLTTKIIWISNQMTPKSLEFQIRWQPNHLPLNSFESDINWLSIQLNSTSPLPIGSLWLETSATASCGRYVNLLYVYIKMRAFGRLTLTFCNATDTYKWKTRQNETHDPECCHVCWGRKARLTVWHFPPKTIVGHPDMTHWFDMLVGHCCWTLLRNTLARHF